MDGRSAQSRLVVVGFTCGLVLLLCWGAAHLVGPVAASGTWVIQDETVLIADTTFTHEGNIVVRGTGRLLLENATLRLQQLASWQFSIRIEDGGRLSANQSRLESKYPFRITLSGNARIDCAVVNARRAQLELGDDATAACRNTSLLGVQVTGTATAQLDACDLSQLSASEDASLSLNSSDAETLRYRDDSVVEVNASTLDLIVADGRQLATFRDSPLGSVRCWQSAKMLVNGCSMTDFRYAESAQATIVKSSIGYLDVTGRFPLRLEEIRIGNVTLTGSANATMMNCTIGRLEAYLYSTIDLVDSSCGYLYADSYVRVTIQGFPAHRCNITRCVITQSATANISWATFDYLEICHSARAQVNDSYVNSFDNWIYGTVVLNISRCHFYDFRLGGALVTMTNSAVDRWANIGGGVVHASSCVFGSWTAFYGNCRASLRNCTVDPVAPHDESQIVLTGCNTSVVILDYNARLHTLDSVPTGMLHYWSSKESNAIPTVPWSLTALDTNLSGWDVHFQWAKSYTVRNCTLRRAYCYGSSQVTMTNIRIGQLQVSANANVSITGNLTRTEPFWIQDQGRVARELTVLVLDQTHAPIANALVDVYSSTSFLLFEGHTSLEGICVFRLTFTAANASLLTDTFRCAVSFGVANNMRFFAITDVQPLVITLDLSGVPKPLQVPVDDLDDPGQSDNAAFGEGSTGSEALVQQKPSEASETSSNQSHQRLDIASRLRGDLTSSRPEKRISLAANRYLTGEFALGVMSCSVLISEGTLRRRRIVSASRCLAGSKIVGGI